MAGLSLIELMVALALAALILLAIVQIFTGSHAAYRVNVAQASVQEAGRYASQILSREMRMARSTGCGSLALDERRRFNVIARSLLDAAGKPVISTARAFGYTAAQAGTAAGLADLPAAAQTAVIDGRVRGDVLVSWGVVGEGTYAKTTASSSLSDPISIVAANAELVAGRLALITDCTGSDVFAITGITNDGAGRKLAFDDTSANRVDAPERPPALKYAYNWTGQSWNAAPLVRARVYPFDFKVFFIGCVDQETGSALPTKDYDIDKCTSGTSTRFRPALGYWSASTDKTAILLMDIADMRVTYDGSIDLGLTASQRTRQRLSDKAGSSVVDAAWVATNRAWDQVDSIRIELLAASTDEVSSNNRKYTDNYTISTGIGAALTEDRRVYQAIRVTVATRATSDWYVKYNGEYHAEK